MWGMAVTRHGAHESVFCAWVFGPTVALGCTAAVDMVHGAVCAGVLGCLALVVVETRALGWVRRVAVPIARRHVVAAVRALAVVVLELDKPTGVPFVEKQRTRNQA